MRKFNLKKYIKIRDLKTEVDAKLKKSLNYKVFRLF